MILRRFLATFATSRWLNIRTLSSKPLDEANQLHFKPEFSNEEQNKVLAIVNQAGMDELCRFDISRGRITKLQQWRRKNGPFRTLSEILEVEGLGEKILERLCKSIILNQTTEVSTKATPSRKQFLTPSIDRSVLNRLENVIALHLTATGVSWAKLQRCNNEIEKWSFLDFTLLPKKMTPNDTFNLAIDIIAQLPLADVYVMESSHSMQKNKTTTTTYSEQKELAAMLLTLINSRRSKVQEVSQDGERLIANKVFYLRAFLPARLFKTLVGTERVASNATAEQLLECSGSLPCTPVAFSHAIKCHFRAQSPIHQHLLGQALMLVVAFMDICVYQTPQSLEIIDRGRRK